MSFKTIRFIFILICTIAVSVVSAESKDAVLNGTRINQGIFAYHVVPKNVVEVTDEKIKSAIVAELADKKIEGTVTHIYTLATKHSRKTKLIVVLKDNKQYEVVDFSPKLTKKIMEQVKTQP